MLLAALIIGIIAVAITLGLGLRLMALERRFGLALGTTEGGNLEKQLQANFTEITSLSSRLGELAEEYARLATAQSLSSQKISIVRFNPFGDTGGDQSFSLAVLDAHDSGYVLTSIHGRQGTRVYVKPIDFGESKHQLSEEEQQVLAQAQKRTIKKKE